MYAQCPECLTIFSLDGPTMAQASGTVGCGQCGATFDALVTLTEELPADAAANLSLHPTSPAPPMLLMKVLRHSAVQQELFADAQRHSSVPHHALTAPARDAADPPFTRFARGAGRTPHTLRWTLACLLLVLCLGGQLAWAERDALTANAHTGPLLRKLCGTLHCTLPSVSDPTQLQLLSRDVRPHPSVPDALLISLAIINHAAFRQPWPVVTITFSDLDDNRIAMRRFKPSEYIRDATVRQAGMDPKARAAIVFEVKDPGKNAVAFQFAFQ